MLKCLLGKLVNNVEYTDDELERLNWEEKCKSIQNDPVTCATHFDYQVNQFLQKFLLSSLVPLGKITDWFYRVEYQQRGLPHIPMLIWQKDALVFGINSDIEVIAFIDEIITFKNHWIIPNYSNLLTGKCIAILTHAEKTQLHVVLTVHNHL